jgi:TolB-like protein/Flp pilus assembly protein TadD
VVRSAANTDRRNGTSLRGTTLRYQFEGYCLDTDRRELRCGGALVPMEPQVFDILSYLIRERERVVSRDDLIAAIWSGRIVSESALTTRINAARSCIGDSGKAQRLIKTFPRKGIRFVGIVSEEPSDVNKVGAQIVGARTATHLTMPDRPSVAVLPFANMSSDPEDEYFADGMTDEVTTALSRCAWLFVIARHSSFTYKGRNVDIRNVGTELGVRYVLEGSVRRVAERVRFTGQLNDASTGLQIWADRFDGEMSDVFELQDRFTESIVAAIEPSLIHAEIGRLGRKPARDLDAYDLLLRAQQLEYECTEETLAAALSNLDKALEIDPEYAPAMALAAYCYAGGSIQGWSHDVTEDAERGLHLTSRALELGKDDATVLWMAAYAIRRLAQDVQRARDLAYRSLSLNPNSAIAMAVAGWMEAELGNTGNALALLKKAHRLSPRDPRGWFIATGMALAYVVDGSYEEAAACARTAVDQNPRSTIALRFLAGSLAQLGQKELAASILSTMLRIEPGLTLSILRSRLRGIDEKVWTKVADGLRLAGLPE